LAISLYQEADKASAAKNSKAAKILQQAEKVGYTMEDALSSDIIEK